MDLPATSQQKKIVAISEIRVTNMVVSSKEGHHVPYREGVPIGVEVTDEKKPFENREVFLKLHPKTKLVSITNRLKETLGE